MSIEHYLAARTEFTNAKAEVRQIADTLAEVTASLQHNPGRFIFANQPIGLPIEASVGAGGRSVDAGRWPNVEQIMRALERWHRGKETLQSTWNGITPTVRDGLKSPDDLLGR